MDKDKTEEPKEHRTKAKGDAENKDKAKNTKANNKAKETKKHKAETKEDAEASQSEAARHHSEARADAEAGDSKDLMSHRLKPLLLQRRLLSVFTPTDYYRHAKSFVRMFDEETRGDV